MNFKNEKILITGGSGFVGRNLILKLRALGQDIFNSSEPSIVFHLGAHVNLGRDYETAKSCFEKNIMGTLDLLESLKNKKIKKLIFLSTEEVYGNSPIPYNENQKTEPPSPYAISKIAAEELCLLYQNLYQLPVTILRLATVYGPYQLTTRFIPKIIKQALASETILLGSADNKRDYVFIDDVIEAILIAAASPKSSGEIINIGHPEPTAVKELVEMILKLTGSSSKINYNPALDRKGEAKKWASDITKAEKILNWRPKINMENGLIKTINYLKNDQIN